MSELRNKLIDRIDVLNKVKELFLIPKLEMMTSNMVAEYYEVDHNTIKQVYFRNRKEINSDGVLKTSAKDFRTVHLVPSKVDFKIVSGRAGQVTYFINGHNIEVNNKCSNFFSPRAVLRIGMLLRDSEVAKEVRTQLLNTFENLLYVLYK